MVSELSSLRPASMESNMVDECFYGRVGKSFKETRRCIGTISDLKDFIAKHFNLPQIRVTESPNGGIVIGNLFEEIPNDVESQDHESFDNLLKLFGWIEGCIELPIGSDLPAHQVLEEMPQWENKNQVQHEHLVAEELSPWAAQQVFDEMPETQGGHKLEELKVSANVHLPSIIVLLEGGILAKKNYLTAINTDSSMEFGNCIARSKYFGFDLSGDGLPPISLSDVQYAGNFTCGISRISRFAWDDGVEIPSFDPGGVNVACVHCFTRVPTEMYVDFCCHFGVLTNVACDALTLELVSSRVCNLCTDVGYYDMTSLFGVAAYQPSLLTSEFGHAKVNCILPKWGMDSIGLLIDNFDVEMLPFDPGGAGLSHFVDETDLKATLVSSLERDDEFKAFGKPKFHPDTTMSAKEQHGFKTHEVKREISIMKLVRQPYVVCRYEVLPSRAKIYLTLDLIAGGTPVDMIIHHGQLSEAEARNYFQQLINSVDYCHSKGVYQRELKPDDLLLDSVQSAVGHIKFFDFGLSARVDYVGVLCFDPGGVNIDYVRCSTQVFTEIYADFYYHFGALSNVPCGAFIEFAAALEAYVPGIDKLELTDANKSGGIVIFEPGESWLLLGDHVIYLSNGRVVVIEEAALRLNSWKDNIQVEASMIRDATLHGTTSEAKYSSNSDWGVEFQIFSAWIQKQDLFSITPGIYVALLLQLLYKCEDLALLAFKDYSCVWGHLYKGYYGKHGKIGCFLFSDLDDWFLDADVHQFCSLPISEEGSIYRENSILALSTSELHAFNIIWADILLGEKLLHERPFEEMNFSAHGVTTQYLAVHLKAEENLDLETIEKLISNSIAVDHALVIVISNAIFLHWITEFDAELFSMKRKSTRLLSFDPGGECSRFNWICEACLMLISAMR